jgi:membrane-bound ClpP family serine protease
MLTTVIGTGTLQLLEAERKNASRAAALAIVIGISTPG